MITVFVPEKDTDLMFIALSLSWNKALSPIPVNPLRFLIPRISRDLYTQH